MRGMIPVPPAKISFGEQPPNRLAHPPQVAKKPHGAGVCTPCAFSDFRPNIRPN
jgi:hypothetical protein